MRQQVRRVVWLVVALSLVSTALSTDLAAVYRHNILILRDADSITSTSPLSWESLSVSLPRPLYYPVSLAQDTQTNRLFVAEAKPEEDVKIYSVFLNSMFEVVDMTPAVRSSSWSAVEGISYSPKSKHLYWTDATNDCIYKASVPSEPSSDASLPELIEDLGHVMKPRGLALDPCKELLYWSERGGMMASSIEMWDPNDNRHSVVQEDKEKDDFYQGLAFDDISGDLVWAATRGPKHNTTCRIVSTSLGTKHQELVNLENCYPFSLTVDGKYTYWTDWRRQGIMRASRTDPSDVVKLVHTPHVPINGDQLSVYGLVKINAGIGDQNCQVKWDKSQNPAKSLNSETVEERGKDTPEVKEPHDDQQSTIDDYQNTETDDMKHRIADPAEPNGKPANPAPTGHSGSEVNEMSKGNEAYEDQIVKDLRRIDSPAAEPEETAEPQPVDTVTRVSNGKTQTGRPASQSADAVPTTEWHNEDNLMLAIVILAVICVVFLCSTIILAVLLFRRKAVPCKTSAAVTEAPHAVDVQAPRQVKRYGPRKSLVSRNKSGISASPTCSGLTNDGVTINIEDCCQMTLCETPCYTTVKKQGKSYKDIPKNAKTKEDKKGLLDDSEEI